MYNILLIFLLLLRPNLPAESVLVSASLLCRPFRGRFLGFEMFEAKNRACLQYQGLGFVFHICFCHQGFKHGDH
ncbi:hypothetical protein RHMOL_Rhmol01G0109300 [Rhododendron molle]|uniref:Uncharacterized protein n=1 Tax=Rhododendron molle TaxID=49168 RepID=A0ACC0Q0P0_RHOML|nr:hypothetical protein RHMOL_Rhmol01G0109300 [Rhododendron molle]